MKTKLVSWAYPFSIHAEKLGFRSTGCYVVEYLEGSNPPVLAIKAGFPTRSEALDAAEPLKVPYNWMQRLQENQV